MLRSHFFPLHHQRGALAHAPHPRGGRNLRRVRMRGAQALLATLLIAGLRVGASRNVTIFNDRVRLDTDGNVVDSHDGCIVPFLGQFFLYGEYYGSSLG